MKLELYMITDAPLIVVVDDDFDVLEWCRLILEAVGFRVACFQNSDAAYAAMKKEIPALVITDLMMANLDSGFDFARSVKESPEFSHLPVIIMTAASSRHGFDFEPKSAADLSAMHVDAYFSKPADPQALVAKVRALISGNSQR